MKFGTGRPANAARSSGYAMASGRGPQAGYAAIKEQRNHA